ncbi:MAG: glutamate formimidoyltransferase [Armatimonadetes bacterium]|nr:glutamate formimidoyltransferase [Armatimonadota bacterium]
MTPLIQCVPNFSEGRRPEVIAAIVGAVRATSGVRLADWSADPDHHRMVVTFLGPAGPVRAAALAAAAAAIRTIDVSAHQGVHPRLGAMDVLPFVPICGITLSECAALAVSVGQELAARHALPVYLYEAATLDHRSLPTVRRDAFHHLPPDFGPPGPHPTAGAVVVGARGPLIAYNVNLAAHDIAIARRIARDVRGCPDLPGVRALGLALHSRGLTQVSMNITRPAETPLLSVFSFVARRARELGTEVVESEVIGALPGHSAFGVLADALQATLKPGQVLLENWPEGVARDEEPPPAR